MLTRRELLGGVAGLPALVAANDKPQRKAPWHDRAAELEEKEGPYCDYAAFCEWAEENWIFDETSRDTMDDVGWYVLCNQLLYGTDKG